MMRRGGGRQVAGQAGQAARRGGGGRGVCRDTPTHGRWWRRVTVGSLPEPAAAHWSRGAARRRAGGAHKSGLAQPPRRHPPARRPSTPSLPPSLLPPRSARTDLQAARQEPPPPAPPPPPLTVRRQQQHTMGRRRGGARRAGIKTRAGIRRRQGGRGRGARAPIEEERGDTPAAAARRAHSQRRTVHVWSATGGWVGGGAPPLPLLPRGSLPLPLSWWRGRRRPLVGCQRELGD